MSAPDEPPRRDRPPQRKGSVDPGSAWNVVGTIMSGLLVWGLVGWGVDRLAGTGVLFLPIGLVVGMFGALYLVYYQATKR